MATYTSYLNLEKPTTSETFNLLKMNQNWDKIDAGVSALNSNIATRPKLISFGDNTKPVYDNLVASWMTEVPNDGNPHLTVITALYGNCFGFISRYGGKYGVACIARYTGHAYMYYLSNGAITEARFGQPST